MQEHAVTTSSDDGVFSEFLDSIQVPMPSFRKLIQDAKAGHFTAVYLVLELIAVGITVVLLIT